MCQSALAESDGCSDVAADIEEIEQRRPINKDMDVIYILTPQSHIVDCLVADFDRRRYRRTFLFWTSSMQLVYGCC